MSFGPFVLFLLSNRPSTNIDLQPQPKVVRSENLLTGQNPESARLFAEEIKKALQSNVQLI